jgi:hypothetical protein
MIKNIVNKIIKNKKPDADTSELNLLYTQPTKENRKDTPSFQVFKEGIYCQSDLLFLPHNYGYKYCLGIVDLHTKHCDFEPIKNKDSDTVVKAFKKIFARGIVKPPKIITFDDGTEFKSTCKAYFKDLNIHVIVAPTGRHRMLGLIERRNQIVGTVLHQIMANEELTSNKINRHWVKYLPEVVEEINKSAPKPLLKEKIEEPIITKANKVILPIGTEVKTLLDYPVDTLGNRLHGTKFRSSDIRWSRDNKEVEQIILQPSQPILYKVDGIKHSFTRQQLLPINFV